MPLTWRKERLLSTTTVRQQQLYKPSMDSSVSIDQDFFESGFSYEGQEQQKSQQYNGYEYDQQYSAGYSQPNTGGGSPSYYPPQPQNLYDYNQYGASYRYDASGPTAMAPGQGDYELSGSMKPRQTSEDYTSFEDEPPLLEGRQRGAFLAFPRPISFF